MIGDVVERVAQILFRRLPCGQHGAVQKLFAAGGMMSGPRLHFERPVLLRPIETVLERRVVAAETPPRENFGKTLYDGLIVGDLSLPEFVSFGRTVVV